MSEAVVTSGAQALKTFGTLVAFGAAEVLVALHPANAWATSGMLFLLAAGQLIYFLIYTMHLREETPGLKRMVFTPFGVAAFYATVLIAESAWRHFPHVIDR